MFTNSFSVVLTGEMERCVERRKVLIGDYVLSIGRVKLPSSRKHGKL